MMQALAHFSSATNRFNQYQQQNYISTMMDAKQPAWTYNNGPSDQYHRNFRNVRTGPSWRRRYPGFHQDRGYGIDLDGNGRFNRRQDGVLVFDMNRDGRYDKRDVSHTNQMMQSATGNYDFNQDGRVSRFERMKGRVLRRRFCQMDRNRDGRLESHEIAGNGGKVWIDRSGGGGIGNDELHSPYQIPSRFIGGTTSRLDFVDPFFNTSGTSRNAPYWNNRATGWLGIC